MPGQMRRTMKQGVGKGTNLFFRIGSPTCVLVVGHELLQQLSRSHSVSGERHQRSPRRLEATCGGGRARRASVSGDQMASEARRGDRTRFGAMGTRSARSAGRGRGRRTIPRP